MNPPRRFLASCGLLLLSSISCTPTPAAAPHVTPAETPAKQSCADESAAEELVSKGEQVEGLDPDQALVFYEQAAALAPKNARIQYRIGTVYKKKEDWDKAAASYGRAANLDPSFANHWFWYGYSLEQLAKRDRKGWEDARKALEKCIEIDANHAECHYRLGNAFLYLDDERKALESYTKAIQIEPTKIDRYAGLADLYLRLDFVNEAEVVLKQAKQFAKPGERALFNVHILLGDIQRTRGAEAESISEFEAAKVVAAGEGPEATMILFILGSSYATSNPPRRAEAVANLKAFAQRACKGQKARLFETECVQSNMIITKMGGAQP